ncbi:hypothetical protein J6590_078341 [Homalodisca vitripennis]|nr:hypothetical protein J6590_078341 [Homalodisca vitripennis]
MVGGTVGHSMCTDVAVLCGRFVVQRISVLICSVDASSSRGYQSEQVRLLLDILIIIYEVTVGGWGTPRVQVLICSVDASSSRGYKSEQVRLLLDILIIIYEVMVGGWGTPRVQVLICSVDASSSRGYKSEQVEVFPSSLGDSNFNSNPCFGSSFLRSCSMA